MKKTSMAAYHEVFSGSPWYGDALWPVISALSVQDFNKSTPQGKRVGHIIEHMLAWRNFVLHQLMGQSDYRLEVNSTADWDLSKEFTSTSRQALLDAFEINHQLLINAIEAFSEDKIYQMVPNKPYSFIVMIMGIRDHDIYHLGQINLLINMT